MCGGQKIICMSLFSPPTAWVPGIEFWLPGPGQVSLPVRPSCSTPTSVQKPHTLAGCDAEHVGGRHRWLSGFWDQVGLHSKFQTSLAPTCICVCIYTYGHTPYTIVQEIWKLLLQVRINLLLNQLCSLSQTVGYISIMILKSEGWNKAVCGQPIAISATEELLDA